MVDPRLPHAGEATLNEYLDNALALVRRQELEMHLAQCAACAARLAELRKLFAALEALPELPLQRDLAPAVVSGLPGRSAHPRGQKLRRLAFVLQSVSGLVLLGLGWPVVASRLEALAAARLDARAMATLVNLLNRLSAEWQAALAPAQEAVNQGLESVRGIAIPAWPLSSWGWLAALALVLWLLGNRWLLRPAGHFPSSRSDS